MYVVLRPHETMGLELVALDSGFTFLAALAIAATGLDVVLRPLVRRTMLPTTSAATTTVLPMCHQLRSSANSLLLTLVHATKKHQGAHIPLFVLTKCIWVSYICSASRHPVIPCCRHDSCTACNYLPTVAALNSTTITNNNSHTSCNNDGNPESTAHSPLRPGTPLSPSPREGVSAPTACL